MSSPLAHGVLSCLQLRCCELVSISSMVESHSGSIICAQHVFGNTFIENVNVRRVRATTLISIWFCRRGLVTDFEFKYQK